LNPNLSDFQNIPFPTLDAPIIAAFSRAGAFRVFLGNNTLLSSLDAGANWQMEALAIEGAVLGVIVKEADFFLRTKKGIWSGQLFMPSNLTKIYNEDEGISATAKSFASLPSGYWINTASNQTIFKATGNPNWQVRSQGLGTKVVTIQGVCSRLYCSTELIDAGGVGFPSAFYVSNKEDGAWEAIGDSSNFDEFRYLGFKYLGKANGYDFAYMAPNIGRSSDCGTTWDTLNNLLVGAAIKGMSTSGTRLFFFSPHDFNVFFTDDNGGSWNTLTAPITSGIQNVFVSGDTILVFETGGFFLYRTINFGQNWETVPLNSLPDTYRCTYWQKGNKIISSRVKYYTNGKYTIASLHVSVDNGTTWQQTFTTTHNYAGAGTSYTKSTTTFPFYEDGLIFMHAQFGLQVSSDEGVHWTRITDIPFHNRLSFNYPVNDTLAEGALTYHVNDGYLYAATEAQGIWRTPFSLIRDQALVHGGQYGFLRGRLYRDLNYNCNYEQQNGDLPLSQKPVLVQPGNILVNTNSEGYFDLALSPGTYQISTALPPYHDMNCGIPYPLTAVVTPGNTTETELPFLPTPGISDACVLFTTPIPARPGFPVTYKLQVSNVGNDTINDAIATLTFNAQWLEAQSISPFGQFLGNQAVISLPSLLPGQVILLKLNFVVSPTTPIGTVLSFTSECPVLDDVKPSNNIARATQTVTGSFDPNDKMAQTVQPEPPGQARTLDYLIRFQNTGTDTAFTVVVTDSLDHRFDLLTIRTVEASHTFDFSWAGNGLAKWTFRNILLPDSTTNEPKSHGYIRFQIQTRPDVLPGSPLLNDADIFFDFNSPVRTNEFASENPKWTVVNTAEVNICTGEVWNGSIWEENAIVSDTSGNAWSDTILLTQVLVSPSWDIQMDTTIDKWGTLFGTTMLSDTVFLFQHQTAEGCDSIIHWEVTVLTSALNDLSKLPFKLEIFPNPTAQEAWLMAKGLDFGKSCIATIRLLDATGTLRHQWLRQEITSWEKINLNTAEIPSGIYFVEILLSDSKSILKLIKT